METSTKEGFLLVRTSAATKRVKDERFAHLAVKTDKLVVLGDHAVLAISITLRVAPRLGCESKKDLDEVLVRRRGGIRDEPALRRQQDTDPEVGANGVIEGAS